MRALLIVLALGSCEKKSETKPTEAPAPTEAAKPKVVQAERAKVPAIELKRAPATVEAAPKGLPHEMNPPNVPPVSGALQVDRDVQFVDIRVGTGASPVKGKLVEVHYSGWLTDGSKFDASVDRGEPIKFPFDGGMVIKGWDIGLSSMKAGGKRRILLPAELAYGKDGAGEAIPPDSILVFDVELISAEQ